MRVLKLKTQLLKYLALTPILVASILLITMASGASSGTQTLKVCSPNTACSNSSIILSKNSGCGSTGSGAAAVQTSIDFGCQGDSCANGATGGYCSAPQNGILDLLFSVIRFLSAGVGIVIVASVIIGGIQYILSRGDPNATSAAIRRLTSAVIALLLFIFAYAILNFVIPGGFFTN